MEKKYPNDCIFIIPFIVEKVHVHAYVSELQGLIMLSITDQLA